jgi:hypothetical protein
VVVCRIRIAVNLNLRVLSLPAGGHGKGLLGRTYIIRAPPMTQQVNKPRKALNRSESKAALNGGLFFVLVGCLATVLGCLLGIARLFSGHISRIEMVLTFRILAGSLLTRVFVVGHQASPGRSNNVQWDESR